MPVFVWYFGGGFLQGGTSSLYFNPQSWVQRTQGHIVVTVNFRSNIFGFPNAANLTDQNLGLLDQRLALEWVRDNIANFGGDPSKIVAWGQSARAIAYDYLNFAYPEDPIVNGMILDSNTTFYPQERIMVGYRRCGREGKFDLSVLAGCR
jgi:acetylcholinesterase